MPTIAHPRRTSAKGRQNGDYTPPVLAQANGGPIPTRKES